GRGRRGPPRRQPAPAGAHRPRPVLRSGRLPRGHRHPRRGARPAVVPHRRLVAPPDPPLRHPAGRPRPGPGLPPGPTTVTPARCDPRLPHPPPPPPPPSPPTRATAPAPPAHPPPPRLAGPPRARPLPAGLARPPPTRRRPGRRARGVPARRPLPSREAGPDLASKPGD